MHNQENTRFSKSRMVSVSALTVSLVFLIGVISVLATDVRARLTELSAADADSAPWQLSQLEVEFLTFKLELREAINEGAPDLAAMREKFDIFYSRIAAINTSQLYDAIRSNPSFAATLAELTVYRDSLAQRFDAGEVTPENLQTILQETVPARENIRALALFGVELYALQGEFERGALASVLSRLALLLGALVACLGGALLVVVGLVIRAMTRSRDILRTSARLKAVSATSLEAILISDAAGRVIDFNKAAEDVFGYKAEEVVGQKFVKFIFTEEAWSDPELSFLHYQVNKNDKFDSPGRKEVEAVRASGEVFPIELAVSRTMTPEGEIFLHFIRDISDRQAAELALREARDEALAGEQAKANLLAVMSHEMRTPLNGILGTLELLNHTDLNESQREHLEIMSKSGDLLLQHINDVLELSRLDSGQAETYEDVFSLPEMLDDIASGLSQLAEAVNTTLDVVLVGDGLESVIGAPRRIRQILVNLAGNAVKFTENGTITLKAAREPGEDVVSIIVSDTGIGIAPEDQARIFDEFVTIDPNYNRRAEGTGLGLAITRRLVEAMGGAIAIASEAGQGSTFTVTLPLPNAPMGRRSNDSAPQAGPSPAQFPGLNVLLVEDNPINRRIAHAMLDGLKCNVTEAENGALGVSAAAARAFDVILMDISMPEMDGIEATGKIRAGPSASEKANIIALTAHAMKEDVDRFEAAGMNDVVVKPVSSERLAMALDRRRAARPHWSEDAKQSVWDTEVFSEFLQVLGAADTQEMLTQFMTDAREVVPWLVWQSSEELEHAEVAKRAHGLAGSAAVLGATELHAALRSLEEAARKDRPISAKGAELSKVWEATEREVPDLRDDTAAA